MSRESRDARVHVSRSRPHIGCTCAAQVYMYMCMHMCMCMCLPRPPPRAARQGGGRSEVRGNHTLHTSGARRSGGGARPCARPRGHAHAPRATPLVWSARPRGWSSDMTIMQCMQIRNDHPESKTKLKAVNAKAVLLYEHVARHGEDLRPHGGL